MNKKYHIPLLKEITQEEWDTIYERILDQMCADSIDIPNTSPVHKDDLRRDLELDPKDFGYKVIDPYDNAGDDGPIIIFIPY